MQPVIYTLQTPIEHNSETITRLEFQPPRGKHIKKLNLQNLDIDELLKVAAKLSGHTPKLFDELFAADVMAISEIIGNFLESGLSTGKST